MPEFKWFGHGCFRIRGREATMLLDPVGKAAGYSLPRQKADIVTVSHAHPGHNALGSVQEGYFLVDGPGEYEVSEVSITGIRTAHDKQGGREYGYNTIYTFELEDIRICHLGDLAHPLTEDQTEGLEGVDVLLIPVGGGRALDAQGATEVIGQIEPRIVIPMHYRTAGGDPQLDDLTAFCQALGVTDPTPLEKLTLRKSDLPDAMKIIILEP